ncbi:fam-b protein [Plasmodium vinckei brucechwatti]|uniref:Fam-b protein n=1 Tax=Plasmodium vinckei brucechwatti TaxID=119398 RepID=A0A6V7T332_PLAVN|nr:fam-b protein [Plasmodium vinckei brucechwatti]
MKISILKYASFSIIICFLGFTKNELHFINEANKFLERNIINFKNNRILADGDNQFDLNNFYQSALSLANQFSDCNDDDDDDDDESIKNIRNIINSRVKKNKGSNTFLNLNNLDKKTRNLIYKLQKELEEAQKELDNMRNGELEIQPTQDKRIINKYENNSVSEQEDIKQLKNYENILEAEHNHFECVYNHITSNNGYNTFKIDKDIIKLGGKVIKKAILYVVCFVIIVSTGGKLLLLLLAPYLYSIIKNVRKIVDLEIKRQDYQ